MKSTGLFGKNSGRVGGVVFSNYRGEQVVRSYQPKVANPNTAGQVAQRAKFKLVSQVSTSLKREITMSFVPSVAKETPRNAFVKEMLKKTHYSNNKAVLPIEDVVLTNSRTVGFSSLSATQQVIMATLAPGYTDKARVRMVFIGYYDGGEIVAYATRDVIPQESSDENGKTYMATVQPPIVQGYTNVRVLAYVYEPDLTSGTSYEDYETLEDDATLSEVLRLFAGKVNFSATINSPIPMNA